MRRFILKSIWKITLVLFIVCGGPVNQTVAQDDIIDHQLWFDVIPHFDINKRLEYFGDISYRTATSGSEFKRFVLKPSIIYNWTYELDLIGGLGLFVTREEEDYKTVEIRPYQGAQLNWPKIWRMNFKHRGLIEERLSWNNEGDFDPNLRLRYRLKTKFPINKESVGYKTLYLPMSYELFGNVGDENIETFQNRTRAMLGLGYVFNGEWIAEIEVTFQNSRSTETNDLTLSDRIFRFKLTYGGLIFGE